MSEFHTTVEQHIEPPSCAACDVKDAEIERLRDILRECDLALSFMPQPTKTLRALRERVREALGE